jgi:hypothetical protein
MLKKNAFVAILILISFFFIACKKENPTPNPTGTGAKLIFKFVLDSTQTRLNNIGQEVPMPSNHAGISPLFNAIAAHYIELAPTAFTQLGKGNVVYKGIETSKGGENALLFDSLKSVKSGETFFSMPLSNVQKGTYEWLRVSLAYQNFDVKFKYTYNNTPLYFNGTIAGFIGFNSYINKVKLKTQEISVNANKKQGFWAFELPAQPPYLPTAQTKNGQSIGTTTVVNPISNSSPVPAGSCVVTGAFEQKLTITGNETQDIIVTVSLSTNKSFEWEEMVKDGWYEPAIGEKVVDMGIRGMKVGVK